MDRYINPFIDYGFKKLFATEANKDLLISFLNAIIDEKEDPVVDLNYKNVEQIGEFNGTRTTILMFIAPPSRDVSSSRRCSTPGSLSSRAWQKESPKARWRLCGG